MAIKVFVSFTVILLALTGIAASRSGGDNPKAPAPWNRQASARYLDSREVWWQDWPNAQRDKETVCISCHTTVPYALARPALRSSMREADLAAPERRMLDSVTKRVNLWSEVKPFYDPSNPVYAHAVQSRATEAVLNTLILVSYEDGQPALPEIARTAFGNTWALQVKTGEAAGSWPWLDFHNAPWEDSESPYQGAALAALAVGMAPGDYKSEKAVQPSLDLLRTYLHRQYAAQPVMNRLVLLWASSRLPGLLTDAERKTLAATVLARQQSDGGWSLTSFGSWKRHDGSALKDVSDGMATGLAVLAIEQSGVFSNDCRLDRGRAWLIKNQNATEGSWPAFSLNKERDQTSYIGHFMTDAASAFATLALELSPAQSTACVLQSTR